MHTIFQSKYAVIAGLESYARLSTTFFSPMPVPLRGLCYSLNLRSIFIDLLPVFQWADNTIQGITRLILIALQCPRDSNLSSLDDHRATKPLSNWNLYKSNNTNNCE